MPIANAHDPDDVHNQALELIKAVYRHEDVGQAPVLIGDVNYWITGEDPDLIPDDYFDNWRTTSPRPGWSG
jgi:hypothetical protein